MNPKILGNERIGSSHAGENNTNDGLQAAESVLRFISIRIFFHGIEVEKQGWGVLLSFMLRLGTGEKIASPMMPA